MLGLLWSLLIPFFMLGIYTFVFGYIFTSKWSGASQTGSIGDYAIILFSGLITFQLFGDVVSRSPALVLSSANYVKKIVFPIQILPLVAIGSALFNLVVSLIVLVGFMLVLRHGIPLTILWLPLILVPYCLMVAGISWFLASLGVYVRDVGQILGTIVTAMMFLSPIFYPVSALPQRVQTLVLINPVATPVELARNAIVFGERPHFTILAIYCLASIVVCWLGFVWFQKTKKGFADVM